MMKVVIISICLTFVSSLTAKELDILSLLTSSPIKGIKKSDVGGLINNVPVYHVHQSFNNVIIPANQSKEFLDSIENVLSAEFVFKQSKSKKRQVATLFSINAPGRMSPELRLILNPGMDKLLLHFNSTSSGVLKHWNIHLERETFAGWVKLIVIFSTNWIKVSVNCQPFQLKVKEGVKLNFSEDSLIYFRQEPGRKRQFVGKLQIAKLKSTTAFADELPSSCDDASDRKLQKREIVDDLDYAEQIHNLESEVKKLKGLISALQSQISDIHETVEVITNSCECANACRFNGNIYENGSQWRKDPCTVCNCQVGKVSCNTDSEVLTCVDPCSSNPCKNGGSCSGFAGYNNFTCRCPVYTSGVTCEVVLEDNCCISSRRLNDCDPNRIYAYDDKVNKCAGVIRDFCDPNPCLNGGTCVSYHWPLQPNLISCICHGKYGGDRCQYDAPQRCYLPKDSGKCNGSIVAWFYNVTSDKCQSFYYTGCYGNNNNFKSYYDCSVTCEVGACCYRRPLNSENIHGFNKDGLDRYGIHFDSNRRQGNATPTVDSIYNEAGYDYEGYDEDGYNKLGIDRHGYNHQGYHHQTRFNIFGYNSLGDFDGIIKYRSSGYDKDGFNRAGFNCHGLNNQGYDYYGLSSGWIYECRAMRESRCKRMETEYPYLKQQVVKFSRGKRCGEIRCRFDCGCHHNNQSYVFGEYFFFGNKVCQCDHNGKIHCKCEHNIVRKEIRDLTHKELSEYQAAIKFLNTETGVPSEWQKLTDMYSNHIPHFHGSAYFLSWLRFYLFSVESTLAKYDLFSAIPYFDWSVDSGLFFTSEIWQANYFGGDGKLENTLCVRSHPFEDPQSKVWSPCLMRNFNDSMTLPNAVQVEMILRNSDYDSFRLYMELLMLNFRMSVGGHLMTPAASYDPVFISHIAFIDKLWLEWESRHKGIGEIFPRSERFITLEPFGMVPDSILFNEYVKCVNYSPISHGAPCNRSEALIKQSNSSSNSYDITEYDDVKYDITGYDHNGLDSIGYSKDGFWHNRINRDGFDRDGYDILGYNKHGFDRRGCSTDNICVPYEAMSSKSIYLYNGFDPYGFDVNGLDENKCNFFNDGPFYLLMKHWLDVSLSKMSDSKLMNMKRTCHLLTNLPDEFSSQLWLSRQSQIDKMQKLVLLMRNQSARSTDSSEVSHQPGLPVLHDRFCVLFDYFSGCDLGTTQVSCRNDLCDTAICIGWLQAHCSIRACDTCQMVFHIPGKRKPINCPEIGCLINGSIKQHKQVWYKSVCNRCQCQTGVVTCTTKVCPQPICSHPVKHPDQCCSSCTGCSYNGRLYENRSQFKPTVDPCIVCSCLHGNVRCSKIRCFQLGDCASSSIIKPAGNCCPMCAMCGRRNHGEKWMLNDCRLCTCQFGKVSCEAYKCAVSINCTHPATPRRQCCPVCQDCLYNGRRVDNNQSTSSKRCHTCTCRDGNITCSRNPCPSRLNCRNPVKKRNDCCYRCPKNCSYDNRYHRSHSSFTLTSNPCMHCTCRDGLVSCSPIDCLSIQFPCKNPIPTLGECCPTKCPQCLHNGRRYDHNTVWTSTIDPCKRCTCFNGNVKCTDIICRTLSCEFQITSTDNCCPSCRSKCAINGVLYEPGDTFINPNDKCQKCLCDQESKLQCEKVNCPAITCQHGALSEGQCCPSCTRCSFTHKIYENGETFVHVDDPCQYCKCQLGDVTCTTVKCPPLACQQPLISIDSCCPICLPGCQVTNKTFAENETFTHPEDDCQTCLCRDSQVTCVTKMCPSADCPNPISRSCCPTCDGCSFKRKSFDDNSTFDHPDDKCQHCSCSNGKVTCQRQECPTLDDCISVVATPGSCCPVCQLEGCVVAGLIFKIGDEFTHPSSECETCVCLKGGAKCSAVQCPYLSCPLKMTIDGSCCPICKGCTYNGQKYENDDMWTSDTDPCLSCSCYGGVVTCAKQNCSAPCDDPVAVAGSCCPVCPKCEIEGKLMEHGEVMLLSACESCTCDSGQLQCVTKSCPSLVDCPNEAILAPNATECCPSCARSTSDCTKENIGEVIHPNNNPCYICKCEADLSWLCMVEQCETLSCPLEHQQQNADQCCATCRFCVMEDGSKYETGQKWISGFDPCLSCLCADGVIKCKSTEEECPTIVCRASEVAIIQSNQCCQVCVPSSSITCRFETETYKFGDHWSTNQCTTCQCKQDSSVHCSTIRCIPLNCSSAQIAYKHPGTCCPRCVERPATCIAFGGAHYRSFDGTTFNFQGACTYELVSDCSSKNFTVLIENSKSGSRGVIWTQSVVVKFSDTIIYLKENRTVTVNGETVNIPYLLSSLAYIETNGITVTLSTNVGVTVVQNGNNFIEISVATSYRQKTCGLCGNYNKFPQDDMRLRTGQIISSSTDLGNDWQTPESKNSSCEKVVDFDPCSQQGYRAKKFANLKCSALKRAPFSDCHKVVSPEPYFVACVHDLCAYAENDAADHHCRIFSTYTFQCSKFGVILEWRRSDLCRVGCQADKGFIFDECGPTCPRTCANKDLPLGVIIAQCLQRCVPGCQCPADKVLHNGTCISAHLCPTSPHVS